jgi:hypothetical protein
MLGPPRPVLRRAEAGTLRAAERVRAATAVLVVAEVPAGAALPACFELSS